MLLLVLQKATDIITIIMPAYYNRLRIPFRRFAVQLLFSILVTAATTLFKNLDLLDFSELFIILCGCLTGFVLEIRNCPDRPRSFLYCTSLSTCLAYLHYATTAIEKGVVGFHQTFAHRQYMAVHLCLVFLVISKFEFYHTYYESQDFKLDLDFFKNIYKANNESDCVFPVSHDPWIFGHLSPPEGPEFELFSKAYGLFLVQWLVFLIIGGLMNVGLKRAIDPSWNDFPGLWHAMVMKNVLFTSENLFLLVLDVLMLRIVRQANHVAFWALMDVVEWCKAYDFRQVRRYLTSISLRTNAGMANSLDSV
jgi:hypothetical protein